MEQHSEIGNKSKNNKQRIEQVPLTERINELVRKREMHEKRIDLLTATHSVNIKQEPTQYSQYQYSNQCSQIMQILNPQDNTHSQLDLNTHVNLLASVSLKTETHLPSLQQQMGELYFSLQQAFPQTSICCSYNDLIVLQQLEQPFHNLCSYLDKNDLWQGLFIEKKIYDSNRQQFISDYYSMRFAGGNYHEILLSAQPIQKEQFCYLIVSDRTRQSTISSKSVEQNGKIVNMRYLLLHRLVANTHSDLGFSSMLNTLFSYPVRHYHIKDTLGFLEFGQALTECQNGSETNTSIYGYNSSTKISCLLNKLPKNKNLKNYGQLIHQYDLITMIQESELQVKSLELKCHKNHFVVLNIIIPNQGEYYLNVGNQFCQSKKSYRLWIVDSSHHILKASVLINGSSLHCTLLPQQYEIFIAPMPQQNKVDINESYDLTNQNQEAFSFWLQSKNLIFKHQQAQIEIHLKEKYNSYCSWVAHEYLKDKECKYLSLKSGLTSQQKISQESQCSQNKKSCDFTQKKINIKRTVISLLGLSIDSYSCNQTTELLIEYQQYGLCDRLFDQNSVTLKLEKYEKIDIVSWNESKVLSVKEANQELKYNLQYLYA